MTDPQTSSKSIEVFFSYSHKDEEMRDELEKHLSILKHRGLISAWHDRKIDAGEEWKGEIDEHLNSAQIILLLISADFLASKYCYDIEMKRAMERHESGEAQVIPIILRHVLWKGSPFSKLQALPTNAEPIKDGKWRSVDEAFADVAEGLEKAIADLRIIVPPPPVPKTIIVDQMYRGNFATISEAIAAADPGSRILVHSGVYDEGLILEKPLEIVGDGNLGDVVVRAEGKDVILFKAARGRVENLVLQQIGGGNFFGVDIQQGLLEIEGCDISSSSLSCVAIHGKAFSRLKSNKIHNSNQDGILVFENGQGIIEDNDIFGNVLSGIEILGAGNPIVRGNKIHDGSCGLNIHQNGQGLIEDNDIFGNALSGIEIKKAGNPTVRGNRINKNVYQAVHVHDKGAGIIKDNDLRDNKMGSWLISDDSKDLVKRSGNQE
jgi:parallel beta-helix repeat protein